MFPLKTNFQRRQLLRAIGTGFLLRPAVSVAAGKEVGYVAEVFGLCFAKATKSRRLTKAQGVAVGETVWTEKLSKAVFELRFGGRLHLGPETRIVIDDFVSSESGELVLDQGAVIFDRSEKLPKIELLLKMQYGQLAVRGTKFFAGPSDGKFGVFVEHGEVVVSNSRGSVVLGTGEGTDFAEANSPPSPVKKWGAKRISAAYANVLR